MDLRPERATQDEFRARHEYLSTSPESGFVPTTCSVQRRDAGGADSLTGCVLCRIGVPERSPGTLATRERWFGALASVFDLPLDDLDERARENLWTRVRDAHDAWRAVPYAS